MAGRDYLRCRDCGRRLVYDGNDSIRDALDWEPIYCKDCYNKLAEKLTSMLDALKAVDNYFSQPGEDDWVRFCNEALEPVRKAIKLADK